MLANIVPYLPLIVAFLLAITCHEYSHGRMAYYWGDDTAYRSGRLTMNPLAHLDLYGTLFFVLSGMRFGWAKPVPVNFGRLRDLRQGMFMVALAGPLANFVLAVVSLLTLKGLVYYVNAVQEMEWFLPTYHFLIDLSQTSIFLNLSLGIFNLLPLPVLDGSKILYSLLPRRISFFILRNERFGFLLLLVMILPVFGGESLIGRYLMPILGPLIYGIYNKLMSY